MKKVLIILGAFFFAVVQSASGINLHGETNIARNNSNIEHQEEVSNTLDSRVSAPLNTRVIIRGWDDNIRPAGGMRVGPYAGWDYAYMASNVQRFYLEPTSNNNVVIRAESPNWNNYNYFNISNRGYIYLDKRANAREFSVKYLNTSVGLGNLNSNMSLYSIRDVRTNQMLGSYRWGGYDYVTIGSGTKYLYWSFTRS